MSAAPSWPPRRPWLKTGERRAVATIAGLFLLLYAAGWWWLGALATVPALAFALGWLTALLLAGARRQRRALDEQLQQIQSLLFLQQTLRPAHPLPLFDRAALFPDAAAVLVGLLRERRPRRVVELGSGVSTLIVAYVLREIGGGQVLSLEHDPHYARLTRDLLCRHAVADFAQVIDAPLVDVTLGRHRHRWYDPRALAAIDAPVDLLLVDGPPRRTQPLARYPALPLLVDRLSAQALIVVDDSRRSDEREMLRRWQTEFEGWELSHIPCSEGLSLMQRCPPPASG